MNPKPNYKQTFDTYNNQLSGEVNKYVDELIGFAKGDYDFAAKYIEQNYKLALGSDDSKRSAFLKQVANGLEEKVGRIAYDYQTGTYRANEDADRATGFTVRNRDLALSRLDQDEKTYKASFEKESALAREQQAGSLNERGILSTPRDQATGLAGKNVNQLEGQINDTMSAYERALGRDRQDITTSASDQIGDIGLMRNRTLDDLTTGARREGIDATNERGYGIDSANRQLEQKKLAAEQQRRSLMNQTKSYADYLARGATGLG